MFEYRRVDVADLTDYAAQGWRVVCVTRWRHYDDSRDSGDVGTMVAEYLVEKPVPIHV